MPSITQSEVLENEVKNLLNRVAKLERQMKKLGNIAEKSAVALQSYLKIGKKGSAKNAENFVNTFGR